MIYLPKYIGDMLVYLSVATLLLLGGCAGGRGAIKGALGAGASEAERKELALKLFKEGAELLYVNNQEALQKFNQASELDTGFIAAYFNAGVAAEALGFLEE